MVSRAEVATIGKGTGLSIGLQKPTDLGGKKRVEAESVFDFDRFLDRRRTH